PLRHAACWTCRRESKVGSGGAAGPPRAVPVEGARRRQPMNRRLMCAAFAALVLSALVPGFIPAAARAAGRADATGFTTAAGADAASEAAGALMAAAFEALPVTRASAIAWSRYEPHGYASRYRPRRERYNDAGSDWLGHSVAQLHAGFFDPDGPAGAGFLVGL